MMKRSVIMICVLCTCIFTDVQAQKEDSDSREDLFFGIKAGLNSSDVFEKTGPYFSQDSKLGFAGGVFLSIPVGKYLGVHPEVLFSQKGFTSKSNAPENSYDFSRTTNFLDIPIMAEFKPVKYVTIMGGPQYSYLMRQYDVYKRGTTILAQEEQFKTDNIRKNIFGAIVGLDINIARYVFSGRYSFDMQHNNGDGTYTIPRYKNSCLQVTAGFRF